MPLYDFICNVCGERFEVMSPPGALEQAAVCPDCGGRDVTRLFGGFTVGGHRGTVNPGTFVKPGPGMPVVHKP